MHAAPFPIFLDLSGRRCLVVGGGAEALRRVGQLRRAGACVEILAETPPPPLAAAVQRGEVAYLGARFAPGQLDGIALAVVAGANLALAEIVSVAAQARGIPVNVMDEPRLCSFIMPAIVERTPVVVAIATGGAAPSLARLLRERIEQLLPPRLGALAALAGYFRPLVARRLPEIAARRRFWERVLTGRAAALALGGDKAAAGAALLDALEDASPATGSQRDAA